MFYERADLQPPDDWLCGLALVGFPSNYRMSA